MSLTWARPAPAAPRCAAILLHGPPSTSGPGRGPFKAVARVRIPLGALPRVLETLALIALEPDSFGKRLVGRRVWSARVGNYRVLYTTERSGVVVRAIRHRAVVYRRRRRRR